MQVQVRGGLRFELDNGDCGFIRFKGDRVRVQRQGDPEVTVFPLNRKTVRNVIRTMGHMTNVRVMKRRDPVGTLEKDYPAVDLGDSHVTFNSIKTFKKCLKEKVIPNLEE